MKCYYCKKDISNKISSIFDNKWACLKCCDIQEEKAFESFCKNNPDNPFTYLKDGYVYCKYCGCKYSMDFAKLSWCGRCGKCLDFSRTEPCCKCREDFKQEIMAIMDLNEKQAQLIEYLKRFEGDLPISARRLYEKLNPITACGIDSYSDMVNRLSRDLSDMFNKGLILRVKRKTCREAFKYYLRPTLKELRINKEEESNG